jgi:hypothetical protein
MITVVSVDDTLPLIAPGPHPVTQYTLTFTVDGQLYYGVFKTIGHTLSGPLEIGRILPDGMTVGGTDAPSRILHEDYGDAPLAAVRTALAL